MAKHPVPKKKTSKARGSRRYKSFQNKARVRLSEAVQLGTCSKCGAVTLIHHVCPDCGFYRGKDVLGKAQKAEEKITKIQA
ncbi:50S ribosomal protein L32 [Patescibacteria group bacterium]|nr:50S ribosomal protein L32 [Patescibacteria group bacterium]